MEITYLKNKRKTWTQADILADQGTDWMEPIFECLNRPEVIAEGKYGMARINQRLKREGVIKDPSKKPALSVVR